MNPEDPKKKSTSDSSDSKTKAKSYSENCVICGKPLGGQDHVCFSCQDEHGVEDSKEVKVPA